MCSDRTHFFLPCSHRTHFSNKYTTKNLGSAPTKHFFFPRPLKTAFFLANSWSRLSVLLWQNTFLVSMSLIIYNIFEYLWPDGSMLWMSVSDWTQIPKRREKPWKSGGNRQFKSPMLTRTRVTTDSRTQRHKHSYKRMSVQVHTQIHARIDSY